MSKLGEIRHAVCGLPAELAASGLVAWTSGNVSARVPGADLMVIKPSGVGYAELAPESMVVCDLDGQAVDDRAVNPSGYGPSSDTATHAHVYRQMPQGGGGVHNPFAHGTARAATRRPVPVSHH